MPACVRLLCLHTGREKPLEVVICKALLYSFSPHAHLFPRLPRTPHPVLLPRWEEAALRASLGICPAPRPGCWLPAGGGPPASPYSLGWKVRLPLLSPLSHYPIIPGKNRHAEPRSLGLSPAIGAHASRNTVAAGFSLFLLPLRPPCICTPWLILPSETQLSPWLKAQTL